MIFMRSSKLSEHLVGKTDAADVDATDKHQQVEVFGVKVLNN